MKRTGLFIIGGLVAIGGLRQGPLGFCPLPLRPAVAAKAYVPAPPAVAERQDFSPGVTPAAAATPAVHPRPGSETRETPTAR